MYAIIRQSGKQYRIAQGDEVVCDRIKGNVGDSIEFDKILLISDGGENIVDHKVLAKYKIKAELVENFKDSKIDVFKYRSKKGYRKLTGHRQHKSRIKISSIGKGKSEKNKEVKEIKEVKEEKKTTAIAKNKAGAKKPETTKKVVKSERSPKASAEAKAKETAKK